MGYYRTHPLQANFQKKLFNKNIIRLKLRAVVESQTVDTNLHRDGFCLSRRHRHVKKKQPGWRLLGCSTGVISTIQN